MKRLNRLNYKFVKYQEQNKLRNLFVSTLNSIELETKYKKYEKNLTQSLLKPTKILQHVHQIRHKYKTIKKPENDEKPLNIHVSYTNKEKNIK